MSSYLYQFWFFAFKTAKNWGFGPRYWNANSLDFSNFEPLFPGMSAAESDEVPRNITISGVSVGEVATRRERIQPSPLCSWSIHYECEILYDAVPETNGFDESADNFQNQHSQAPWPASWYEQSFDEKLISGLEHNDFSTIETNGLPLAVPQIVKATEKAPDVLLREAFGFAIMGRNLDLIVELLYRIERTKMNMIGFYPLHLATSFLDGVTSCCNILGELLVFYSSISHSIHNIRDLYVNDLGHTVLDNLMISILKSHTSTTPSVVDHQLRFQKAFAGEEVDICGRWDADSDCFRHLLLDCGGIVPKSWKHKFCHTSAQTICHCISLIDRKGKFNLSTPSGIFLNHCSECGLKMQLQPLHTLVMTAFQLASCGCPDEDLFGILACLLYLLVVEVDPLKEADVSAENLFKFGNTTGCSHQLLTAAELADCVPEADVETWPASARIGWQVFRRALWLAQIASRELLELEELDECFCDYFELAHIFHKQRRLGDLYAAIQTEFLTYRRLQEGDPWISKNFDLSLLLQDLQNIDGQLYSVEMVANSFLKPFCDCGAFKSTQTGIPSASDVCKYYFSNMDNWSRTKFIPFPNLGY